MHIPPKPAADRAQEVLDLIDGANLPLDEITAAALHLATAMTHVSLGYSAATFAQAAMLAWQTAVELSEAES